MYTATGTINKERHVAGFAPLVKRIAHHMMAKLPASVQVDDLVQAGMIGLLDAISRYEDSLGAQFETYAAQRIRGAMLDELRRADWLPRSLRKKMRRIEAAVNALEQRLGCSPTEQELAHELNVSLAEYHEILQDARGGQLIYYEDFRQADDGHFLDRCCPAPERSPRAGTAAYRRRFPQSKPRNPQVCSQTQHRSAPQWRRTRPGLRRRRWQG